MYVCCGNIFVRLEEFIEVKHECKEHDKIENVPDILGEFIDF